MSMRWIVLLVLLGSPSWAGAERDGGQTPQPPPAEQAGFSLITQGELGVAERRGRQLYTTGTTATGREVSARVGAAGIALPGRVLPCANCHGSDGLGRPEGGVIPSNITWSELTKSYGVVSASGRKYPAYDEVALARALFEGVDPAGNVLDTAMPRFEMDPEDLQDLIAYLKVIDRTQDPGVTAERITLGTLMPADQNPGSLGHTLSLVLAGYFQDLNAVGGIYNRQVQLVNVLAASEAEILPAASMLIEDHQVFALVGALAAGKSQSLSELLEERRVPSVGPLGEYSDVNDSLNRYSFFLFSDYRLQQRALMRYALDLLGAEPPKGVVLYPDQEDALQVAGDLKAQAAAQGWVKFEPLAYPASSFDAEALAASLQSQAVEVLFFLDRGERLRALLEAAARRQWFPQLFLSAAMSTQGMQQAPEGFAQRLFLAYPTLPGDLSPEGLQEFQDFHRRHGLGRQYLQAQIAAYTAAKLMVEGLKKAGRNLTREKLVAALESLYQYDTGLTPKLTFGPNRHLGAAGAYIVPIQGQDLRPQSSGTWVVP